ncbi:MULTISPECIES: hypothetical protein [Bacillus]|uniref:Uncharacterized protein n=2 Tax=Bacillus cereus group TaxID=86661 RepID=A0A2A7DBM0_BACAN|nr:MULTISPECIES: hypothetical protein [Bacillus]MCP1162277.1 hypothetical protein [Bacillus sp. 1813sda1]MDC7973518.1 hypothetical protein [Bacillus sp. BLCC-B18]OTW67537.1 hypothetical protein BK707_20420 [Bacillus thuringiensis serovar coreanensis]OTX44153.1 hypothetical protein BK724_15715 [Bacillus thuringiensis serovar sooncheon]OTX53317.1 hypothetical protein BK725_14100 [Bacillus thuringiensis serovar guiyangiensis]
MKKIIGVMGIILFVYYALHSTPSMALRTALFFEGHPSVAFSDGVTKETDVKKEAIPAEYQTLYGKEEEGSEHYFFPHVRAKGSGIDMISACVTKKWFFYTAELGCY